MQHRKNKSYLWPNDISICHWKRQRKYSELHVGANKTKHPEKQSYLEIFCWQQQLRLLPEKEKKHWFYMLLLKTAHMHS